MAKPTRVLQAAPPVSARSRVKTATLKTGLVQLKVELVGASPKIWRRLLLADTVTLSEFHRVLLAAFSWRGGHLHEYEIGGVRYGTDSLFMEDDDEDVVDGSDLSLRSFFDASIKRFDYVYDLGDNWVHRVMLEKREVPRPQLSEALAYCTEGANAAPPEDCGGVVGYSDFKMAITDKSHPQHEELMSWIGYDFDPVEFSLDETNRALACLGSSLPKKLTNRYGKL